MLFILYLIRDFFAFLHDSFDILIGLIMRVFDVIGTSFSFLGSLFSSLPLIFYVPLIALVAIGIVYKILGREGAN